MHVMTDGKSVEVIAPQLLKNRAIGLCGDMNGEEIADLSTPKRCIMQPKLVAISYMLNRNGYDAKFAQCHNIEPQDLAAYQREDQKCAKEEVVKTPILAIFERVQRMTLPLVAMHKVEKQTNKVCISKEKVKTCGSLLTGKQLGSGSMKEKLVKYACVSAPSAKAESLKNRAMAGEALDFELNELPISYTKMEKEPFYCGVKGGKLKLYQGCDMNAGVLNNPACGSGEKCVSVYGSAGDCEPITGLEGGAGGLGGGYGSELGSGIQGGIMDAPGCEWLPKDECSDPKTRLRCPTRCVQGLGSDNEMLNLRGGNLCMVFQCGLCEIKGRELRVWASSEDHCKQICLENKKCMGVDYDILFKNRCFLNWEDVNVVGTKHGVGFKAFRKDTCPEGVTGGLGGGYGSEFGSDIQGAINAYQQEGESCGMGIEKNHGQCRPDLECVFGSGELIGTCQVKKQQADCSMFNDEGFDETRGAICKGNTNKALNDIFDVQFQEENLSNCKKFCNCQKKCKGFNFNPNSNKRKCSWKTDSPIETFTNAGIVRSGQSCVIKGLQLENGEESLVGGYGSGSGRDAYGSGLEGGSIDGSYGMGGGYRSEVGNGGNGMEGGYVSGIMGGDFGYGAGKGAHGMGGYGGARHGMGGGYGGGSESGAGGLRGGYGSEFGNGAPACVDELPSDYPDSICYTQYEEKSCEIIATDASQCDMLWSDTGCSQHAGLVRDTCRKSCGNCKSSGHSKNLQTGMP